jgi:hypothetical protein
MDAEPSKASLMGTRCWPGEYILCLPVNLHSNCIVHETNVSRTRIYGQLPPLGRPENNVLLLLTWSASISSWSEQDHNRPFVVLEEWAQSQDGWEVYLQLATDF